MRKILISFALALPALAGAQSRTLASTVSGADIGQSIEGLLVDSAQASVSAGALANVGDGPLTVVENVRDFSALIKSFDSSVPSFGISITPARTRYAFPRISLAEYSSSIGQRLLGSLTFSYAQSRSENAGTSTKFDRRAVSVETSAFFDRDDDPVVAVANYKCVKKLFESVSDRTRGPTLPGPPEIAPVSQPRQATASEAFESCVKPVLDRVEAKWNRSRFSISYGTGRIKLSEGGSGQKRLGQTAALGVVYGFNRVPPLQDSAAVMLIARHSRSEPVLESLVSGPVKFANTTLLAGRISGGSSVFRGLLELSNAKSRDITTSQSTFTRALGLDYRVTDGLWLGLRAGRQRKIDGSGTEVGSFATLSYSPKATLPH